MLVSSASPFQIDGLGHCCNSHLNKHGKTKKKKISKGKATGYNYNCIARFICWGGLGAEVAGVHQVKAVRFGARRAAEDGPDDELDGVLGERRQ